MHYIRSLERLDSIESIVPAALVREQSRIDYGCDSLFISHLISAAFDYCEGHTRRAIGKQRFVLTATRFDEYQLSHPAWEIESVEYFDESNAQQTLPSSEYYLSMQTTPARIKLMPGKSWPTVYDRPDAVKITYISGDAPESIKHAITLLVAHWYEHREAAIVGQNPEQIPLGVESLLYPYRIYAL